MTFYCHTTDCLRDYMLRYFGEFGSNYCGNCSNCLNTFETIDITELANDLIGCILTSGMRFGVNVILDTLRGSKNEKVLRFGLDSNRYYATHAQDTIVFLRQVLNYLVLTDYLVVTDDQFPIVKVKEKGLSFYAESGEFRPVLTMKAARKTTQTPAKAGQLPARTNPAESVLPCTPAAIPSRRCAGCVPKSHGHSIFHPILSFPTSHWNPCVSFCLRLKMKCSLSMASAS